MLTIVAPNSSLGDILRGVRKQTSADIDIPPAANERVATRLGPGPAREIMAELLNGSRFNYVLIGSPENASLLVRVVLVPKTPDAPVSPVKAADANGAPNPAANAVQDTPEEVADEPVEEPPTDQGTADAEQQPQPDQPGVKTPQQMLQEMQQRQLMMQQQQQTGQQPVYPPPGGIPRPGQPPQEQQ
jgi:hypothetical protein